MEGKIKSFVWKKNRFLVEGLFRFFHSKMEGEQGNTYVLFCYRAGGTDWKEDLKRVYNIDASRALERASREEVKRKCIQLKRARKPGKGGTVRSLKNCWEEVAHRWSASARHTPAPVDGYRGVDPDTLDRLATERTLGVVIETGVGFRKTKGKCANVADWKKITGRDKGSFDLEYRWNRRMLRAEGAEALSKDMFERDATEEDEDENPPLDMPKKKAVGLRRSQGMRCVEQRIAQFKRKRKPQFKRVVNHDKPVTRHGVGMRVVTGGDVVLMDPASELVRVVSKVDVVRSCDALLSSFVEYWGAYRFKVNC